MDQRRAASTVHTSISGKSGEGCSWKRQNRTYAVDEQREFKKVKNDPPSLTQVKNNVKKKAKAAASNSLKQAMKLTSDMVKDMNNIAQKFGGSLPQHVFSKIVTNSDTQKHHNRLLLPAKTNDLKKKLEKILKEMHVEMDTDAKGNMELPVVVVDGCSNTYDMKFRYLTCNGAFRIIGNDYNKFVQNNELKCQDAVHMWIFQVERGARREVWLGVMKEELSKAPVMALPLAMAMPEMKVEDYLEAHGYRSSEDVLFAAETLMMMSTSLTVCRSAVGKQRSPES